MDVVGNPATYPGYALVWYENRGPGLGFASHIITSLGSDYYTSTGLGVYQLDGDGGPDMAFVDVPYGSTSGVILWYQSTACPAGRYGIDGAIPCHDCAAGYVGPWVGLGAETGDMCAGPCAPGQYSTAGSMSCSDCSAGYTCGLAANSSRQSQCPLGTYSEGGASSCSMCPSGRFGRTAGLTSPLCTGPCPAGYMCSTGTANATASVCPPGQFSGEGASMCTPCPAGRYGEAPPLVDGSCTGPCAVGRWGVPGATTPDCNGPCDAGYACPQGLSTPSPGLQHRCPAGKYSAVGQGVCTPCPQGRHGSLPGAESSACTGVCAAGRFCPEGSSEQEPYVTSTYLPG